MLNFKKMIKNLLFLILFILLSCNQEPKKSIDFIKIIEKSSSKEEFLEKELNVCKDLDIAIEKAKTENKPIFIYFTGHGLPLNNNVKSNILLKNETTFNLLKNNYINAWLYVNDKVNGQKWIEYQKNNFKYIAQPYFCILNSNGIIISKGIDYGDAYKNLEQELKKYI